MLALMLLASAVSTHAARYRGNRRPVSKEAIEASHEGDFDPTHAIMSRRLLRDPLVHEEEDARATLRQLHEAQGPRCRARLRRLSTAYGG